MKEFKGRVIAGGAWKGEAAVSHQGFNTLASFQKSALKNAKQVYVSDQNNKDLFGVNITGNCYDDSNVLNIAYAIESTMPYKGQIAKEVHHD